MATTDQDIYDLIASYRAPGGVPVGGATVTPTPGPAATTPKPAPAVPGPAPGVTTPAPAPVAASPATSPLAIPRRTFSAEEVLGQAYSPFNWQKLGWTGGEPFIWEDAGTGESGQGGGARLAGVTPEFVQWFNQQGFQVDNNFGGQANPNTATWTLYKNGQQIDQQSQSKSGFERFMDVAGPVAFTALMMTVTGGAIGPALAAAGVPAAVATAITPAIASSAIQLAQTGKVDLKNAAIVAASSYIAPQIAQSIGSELQTQYGLSNSQVRAVQNSIASAAATALRGGGGQQALRNAIAGAVAEGVGNATGNAALGRSAGTFVSTGNLLTSAVAGLSKQFGPTGKAPAPSPAAVGSTPAPAPAPGDATSIAAAPATDIAGAGTEPTGDVTQVPITAAKPTGPEMYTGAPTPAPAPAPAARAPAPPAAKQPVDMYTTIRKDRGTPYQLGTMLQGSLAPTTGLTQALGGFRAPGDVTTDPTGKKRQMVWNEASLKNLQDSLGI